MLRFRLILTWLLLAALPLQGWAAATMLWCGPVQQIAQASDHHDTRTAQHVMHDGHDTQDGHHAQTGHAQHHGHTGDVSLGDAGADDGAMSFADGSHTCGVCASCCNGVALAQTPRWPSIAVAPAAEHAEPLIAVLARPSPVPDKPPRA